MEVFFTGSFEPCPHGFMVRDTGLSYAWNEAININASICKECPFRGGSSTNNVGRPFSFTCNADEPITI